MFKDCRECLCHKKQARPVSKDYSALRQSRIITRVNRMREECFLVKRPELADVLISLDGSVDEFPVRFLDAPDVEVADGVAEMIKLDRAARRIG